MTRGIFGGVAAAAVLAAFPALAAGGGEGAPHLDGAALQLYWVIPFVGILLSIAIFPLVAPDFWHHHFGKISAFWAVAFLAPFTMVFGPEIAIFEIIHVLLLEYIPFIILLLSLFTVAGGVRVRGRLVGTPTLNTGILFIGTVLASWMGTTGAAMLLIRPLMRANEKRRYRVHTIVFFIFLVANIGGSLTPLGDPPLFLGFLKGVDFFWPTTNMFLPMLMVSVILLMVSPLWLVVDACADEHAWPSFRGPGGTGIGSGTPPATWDVETGENVVWKVAIPGLAHSSPVVWGDRIYLTTAMPLKGEAGVQVGWLRGTGESAADEGPWRWQVMCLDKATGKVLWQQTAHEGVPRAARHLKATHANCTPATDGKHVVAFFGSEGLHVFDIDGKLLWKKDLGRLPAGPVGRSEYQWGFASSPILHENQVIVQCDVQGISYWASFDLATGKELRRIERGDDPSWATPTVVQDSAGKDLVVCNGYKKMAAYELDTGVLRWHLGGGGDVPVPRPVPAGNRVVLANGHGPNQPVYVVSNDARGDLTPTAEKKPEGLVWWERRGGSYMPTPLVLDGGIYVADDNGVMTRYSLEDGSLTYKQRLPGGRRSTYSASAIAAGGRIYTTSESGRIDVIAAGEEYEVLGANRMHETCLATPAISNGRLYVRTIEHLYCIAE